MSRMGVWKEFIVLYGAAWQAVLDDYFASATFKRYAEQMAPFRDDLRVEHCIGTII